VWITVARWNYADKRICGAMIRHTIWQQGLAINESRLAIVQSRSKVRSQLLAKTCRDVAQLGEKKGRWKECTEQANNPDFSFFLNFSLIFSWFFQKAIVGIKLFYFFTIFLCFSLNKDHKRCNHKNSHL
jgi:hypothetical protein